VMRMYKNDLKFFLYLIKKEMLISFVNRFARSSYGLVRFNSSTGGGASAGSRGSGGGGNKGPAGPHVLIPLFVGYYLIFKPLKN
jgi:hypothetical protein